MKKVLIASDSFKGSLTSEEIVEIAKELVEEKYKDSISLDWQIIADGGEGTIKAISFLKEGKIINVKTIDAEGREIAAPLFLMDKDKSALIEASSIVGLPFIQNTIDPLKRTTKGIGIVIKQAMSLGAKRIYVGLGGTSTNDLGIGMLEELGVDFNLDEPVNMSNAMNVKDISLDNFINKYRDTEFICLSDVTNPLLGENGATYTFGPQKGYGNDLPYLERCMEHLTSIFERKLSRDLRNIPSLGAAGGLGAAFYAFLNARIVSGIDEILSLSNFKERAKNADYVITGEGCFDAQSLNGKVFTGIFKNCDQNKMIVICGKTKIHNYSFPTYVTSRENESFEDIKLHAKEEYKEALDLVFQKITNLE